MSLIASISISGAPEHYLSVSDVLYTLEIALFLCSTYLFFRIFKISRFRINLIGEDYIAYLNLPSFENMLLHFWIWPLSRFITRRKKSDEEELEALVKTYKSWQNTN
jgi:hypothetical protein